MWKPEPTDSSVLNSVLGLAAEWPASPRASLPRAMHPDWAPVTGAVLPPRPVGIANKGRDCFDVLGFVA